MSISLKKGEKISLSKGNDGLSKIIVGLGWDEGKKATGLFASFKKSHHVDCDASAVILEDQKLTNNTQIVYFKNLQHSSGAVIHLGDNLTGEGTGDDEEIIVDLSKLPINYNSIVFIVNIYQAKERKQHFGMIENAFIRIIDARNNKELCRYSLTDSYVDMTAMIIGEVYREGIEWKFNALGEGTTDAHLGQVVQRYC
ncbi:MAG: stress protein [Epulopiscium sp. Nuni2H_MBin003]|nr:MAG: stress protein [Epulopiscium sp. Nuni2H_MBin003]